MRKENITPSDMITEKRKENITPSNMIRRQNIFLARNLFISRSSAAWFPHGALKLQPRDENDISHWSVKKVSGSKNIVTEPSMEDSFSYLIFSC